MPATIATVSQANCIKRTVSGNLDHIERILDDVFVHRPDLVCLPEAFTARGVAVGSVADVSESLSGPTIERLSERAKDQRCFIVCPIYLERSTGVCNSAVVIGRDGNVTGVYDKLHPCMSSPDDILLENGVIPGSKPGCFELDFGAVGLLICMDVHFPESWQELADNGRKLVLWPSAVPGGLLPVAFARLHQYYVATAVRTGTARIIDPMGANVAVSNGKQPYALARINLDYLLADHDSNPGLSQAIYGEYGDRVRVTLHSDERLIFVEPLDGELTTAEIQRTIGFDSFSQFLSRHKQVYARFRSDRNC